MGTKFFLLTSNMRLSISQVILALIVQSWLAAVLLFVFRHIPSGSVTIRQPSGHVRHETLWRELNNDRPLQGGIVDTYTVESISFRPRVTLVHNFLNSTEVAQLLELGHKHMPNTAQDGNVRMPQTIVLMADTDAGAKLRDRLA